MNRYKSKSFVNQQFKLLCILILIAVLVLMLFCKDSNLALFLPIIILMSTPIWVWFLILGIYIAARYSEAELNNPTIKSCRGMHSPDTWVRIYPGYRNFIGSGPVICYCPICKQRIE